MTGKSQDETGKSRGMNIEAECTSSSNTYFLNQHDDELRYQKTAWDGARAEKVRQTPPSGEKKSEKPPAEAVGAGNKVAAAPPPPPPPCQPPRLAVTLLILLLSNRDRESLLGDLQEEFEELRRSHGLLVARLWYWKQVVLSAWPLTRKAIRCLVKSGLITLLGDANWPSIPKWVRPLIEEFLRRIIR